MPHEVSAYRRFMPSPRRRLSAAAVLLAAASLGLTACGSSGSNTAADTGGSTNGTFDIVDLEPLSGPLAAYGQAGQQAAKAAVDVLNKSGGVLGQKVTIKVVDTAGTATQAATALQQVLNSGNKPDLIMPGATGIEGTATVPLICGAGILSIGSPNVTSLNDPSKYPCFFSTAVPEKVPAGVLGEYAKAQGWSSVAVLTATDAYGASVASEVIPAIKGQGISVTAATFDDTQNNFVPTLQRLKDSKAQALVFNGQGPVVSLILKARQTLNWNVPVVGDLGVAASPAVTATDPTSRDLLAGVKVEIYHEMLYVPEAQQTPAFKAFQSAMLAQGKIDKPLITYSGHYDAVMLAATAAEQAKSTQATAMEQALESLQVPATPKWIQLSKYEYSADNHFPAGSSGDFSIVDPTPLSNGQMGKPAS